MPRAHRPELALALASILSVVAVLEGAFRLWAWRENRHGFERAMALARPPAPGATVTLGGLIRPSPNPRIVYELWPGVDVVFDDSHRGQGKRVLTSRAGFRDRDYAADKRRGVRRIVGIGDSLMFGWGVEQGQDYLSLLEERLNAGAGAGAWEVLNTAVPGYNTAMEVETLEAKGLAYRPDLVVLGFCANDASLPNFILAQRDVLSLRESFLAGFVRSRFEPPPGGDALVRAPRRGDDRAFEDDPSRVPSAYRPIAGWEAFERALRRLRDLAQIHGFRIARRGLLAGRHGRAEGPRAARRGGAGAADPRLREGRGGLHARARDRRLRRVRADRERAGRTPLAAVARDRRRRVARLDGPRRARPAPGRNPGAVAAMGSCSSDEAPVTGCEYSVSRRLFASTRRYNPA